MMSKLFHSFCLLGVTLFLFSCDKRPQPTSDVNIEIAIEVDGVPVGTMRSGSASSDGIGQITGGGSFYHGEVVTVLANTYPKSKYKLYSLYEKEGRGGYTKERGLVNETSILGGYKKVKDTTCSITFSVTENMNFIAQFVSQEGGEDLDIIIDNVTVKGVEQSPDVVKVNTTETNN